MKNLEVLTQNSNNKPAYRDYQKFLSGYNDGKSDHRSASPTSLSAASSTSSVPSTISETDNVPLAFNEYLQKYGNKKYSTVRPNLPKKNVKTELFIQVNTNDETDNLNGRKFATLQGRKPHGKIVLARHNSLNRFDKGNSFETHDTGIKSPPSSPAGHLVTLSPPTVKQDVVPDEMIYAKTSLLNELSSRMPKLNKVPPPELKTQFLNRVINGDNIDKTAVTNNVTSNGSSLPPPPPKLPDFTNNAPVITLNVRKVTPTVQNDPKPIQVSRPSFISEMQSKFNENNQNGFKKSAFLNGTKQTVKVANLNSELPPPLPKGPPPKCSNTQIYIQNGLNGKSSPPLENKTQNYFQKIDVEPNTTTYVPVADNTAGVDKNNPNVKKLVYNTYRGLLGAYNNKANNVVSMPKNRVVQDQGVAKQLESIELQGCLDKLNGRVNPNGENE